MKDIALKKRVLIGHQLILKFTVKKLFYFFIGNTISKNLKVNFVLTKKKYSLLIKMLSAKLCTFLNNFKLVSSHYDISLIKQKKSALPCLTLVKNIYLNQKTSKFIILDNFNELLISSLQLEGALGNNKAKLKYKQLSKKLG
uniref:Uncharacterized protein n=1 Tax=Amorphochlora amoebiformis TaxID=1561963 RepID=A0A0H5BKU7_9EUKA|nr:hypothetical protein [Amorphochlora amoebiformis]